LNILNNNNGYYLSTINWYGQYGIRQLNHFVANDSAVTKITKMYLADPKNE